MSKPVVIICSVIVGLLLLLTFAGPDLSSTENFMPHGFCLAWNPRLLAFFVAGNVLVALSYYSIPAALWVFVRKRKDLAFNWMFRLFAAFIFWCGTTHVMKLWTIWHANYWAEALVDFITGVLSAVTALLLWPLIPKALAMRSPEEWEQANQELQESLAKQIRAEKSLVESEERTRQIIESANDAFVAIDSTSKITDWNAQAESIFGWSRAEVIGRTLTETIIPSRYHDAHNRGLQHALKTGEGPVLNKRVEMHSLRKDGDEFPIELSIFPVKTGETATFCAFVQDITERKHTEEAVLRVRDQAVEASRFKSEFVANMSHEIRTPMNAILGMTEILLRSSLNDQQHKYAMTIKDAGQSLLTVINDILDFSKIEAGKLVLDVCELDSVSLIESIAELLAPAARDKNLTLLTFVDPQIPKALRGDQGRLRQILMNLAGNAIKFSEKGEVLMRASLVQRHDTTMTVKFAVTDAGIGMSEEELSQLFQPFVQVDDLLSRKVIGTGLGLSICKRLVELMNGEIGVHSVKGHGSTFWFSVPLGLSPLAQPSRPVSGDLTGLRVLIVDDEKNSREILHDYLVYWGMRNGEAKTADEALTILRTAAQQDPYAVVVIDLIMPNVDGMQLGKIIREDEDLKNSKLILLTAFDKPGTGEEAIALGFDGYLTKPVKQSHLLDCITQVMTGLDPMQMTSSEEKRVAPKSQGKRKELILVAEDHPTNQAVALLLLKDLGFEAHIASNGQEALELMQRVPYSLVFMDCQMPELNGFDATRMMRKIETRTGKHTLVVAMTAHAIEGSREQCLAAGMDDYLSKPIDPLQLKSVLDKWLPDAVYIGEKADEPSRTGHSVNSATDSNQLPKDPTMDFKTMAEKLGGEKAAREILSVFIKQTPLDLDLLKQAIFERDEPQILSLLHQLKAVFATLHAQSLEKGLEQMEQAIAAHSWQRLEELAKLLEADFLVVAEGFETMLEPG